MIRTACPYGKAVVEGKFATFKTERFGEQVPENRADAQALRFACIGTFYRRQRLHSAAIHSPQKLTKSPVRISDAGS